MNRRSGVSDRNIDSPRSLRGRMMEDKNENDLRKSRSRQAERDSENWYADKDEHHLDEYEGGDFSTDYHSQAESSYRTRDFDEDEPRRAYRSDWHAEPSRWESIKGFFGRGPKGYKRSDERVHEDVCEVLYRHEGVDATEIEVNVKDGDVTLSGTVHNRQAKRWAEDAIYDLPGVGDIHNNIRISRHIKVDPSEEVMKKNKKSKSSRRRKSEGLQ